MLEKVKMLKDNNGVGTVKNFTPPSPPPKSCLQGGVKMSFRWGWKKNFGLLHAPFVPLSQISPPPPLEVFLDPPLPLQLSLPINVCLYVLRSFIDRIDIRIHIYKSFL